MRRYLPRAERIIADPGCLTRPAQAPTDLRCQRLRVALRSMPSSSDPSVAASTATRSTSSATAGSSKVPRESLLLNRHQPEPSHQTILATRRRRCHHRRAPAEPPSPAAPRRPPHPRHLRRPPRPPPRRHTLPVRQGHHHRLTADAGTLTPKRQQRDRLAPSGWRRDGWKAAEHPRRPHTSRRISTPHGCSEFLDGRG